MKELQQRLAQAAHAQLSRDEVLAILEERTQAAQHELARQIDAGDDVLSYLAAHGGTATRRAVAANFAAPVHVNQLLSEDEDDDVRAELARKIARLMPDLSREEARQLRAITIEMLEKLAQDQAPRVRAILADEIKHLDCIPKSVVDRLARDIEEVVAAPILEYSPLLSDADLIEIIAGAKAEHVLAAVARRQPLNHAVSDAIVASLDISAVAALLANSQAAIREQTLDKLVESAERVEDLHVPLTLRTDLSARTIRRLASFVGTALLENLMARGDIDDDTRTLLNKRLRKRLQTDDGPESVVEEGSRMVAAAACDGRLNDEFLIEVTEAGNKEAVIMALATLAKVSPDVVSRVIESQSAKGITALVWKAHLSMRVAFKIQIHVMKLVPGECLAARGGKDFPLTEDEMLWLLDYFGVPKPSSET
ncbi:MAG: DUF2336 domain-containing protein [Alphaproteobacteria bacterium]|nr:DUF2336 domain-containing protein [Alphaproteobacteria bacterium]MDE2111294.1 DUF2336 domain-containing protein [Alphaproteobacteria bacterium]MDE2495870.1 DUF2336 domain-containing protein [Alphaproteobacteria bacterium]